MTLADVTRDAVLAAIAEYDDLGRKRFLEEHGFGEATAYYLEHNGRLYDSKAIVGVAHGISGGRAWGSGDFTGGDATVAARLRQLGFVVRFLRIDWTRDEIILVCALVEQNGWRGIAQDDARAIELSQLLQKPAIHPLTPRPPTFRNPAGVARKSYDIASRHPNFGGKPTNGNRLDAAVLQDFLHDPEAMHARARAIREALIRWADDGPLTAGGDLDMEAEEGGVLLKQHLRHERDPRLKKSNVEDAKRRGVPIACEVCGFDFRQAYGARGRDYIECHHRTPLGVSGKVTTRLVDLALICSNCHRMIHRTKDWLTVEALRDLVDRQRATTTTDQIPRQSSPEYAPKL